MRREGTVRLTWLRRLLPFTAWAGEWRRPEVVRADVMAGLTVALVLIPQSMAYAQLAGLPAQHGLYAALLPPVVGALFGSSRQMVTGPVALTSLITAATISGMGVQDPQAAATLAVQLALVTGVLLLGFGLLRLGWIVSILPHPVVVGFTNAAALIIATSQLDKVLGVAAPKADHHYQTLWYLLVRSADGVHGQTVAMAGLAAVLVFGLRAWNRRLPGVLIAAVVTTTVAACTGYTGKTVGAIPAGLPSFSCPSVAVIDLPRLAAGAGVLFMMGFMEAVSIAQSLALRTRQRLDINQELIGQGLACTLGSLTQAYPVSGSFSRSALNHSAGARTGFSSAVASLAVVTALLWLTPLLYRLPHATLAVIIVAAVTGLVNAADFKRIWRVSRADGIVALTTFVATLVFAPDIEHALFVGIGLSLVLYLRKVTRPHVAVIARHPDGDLRDAAVHGLRECRHIAALRFDARLFFGNSAFLEEAVLEHVASRPDVRCVLLDCGGVNSLDATGEHALSTLLDRLREGGSDMHFVRVRSSIVEMLTRTGFAGRAGADHFHARYEDALEAIWAQLGCDHRDQCPLAVPTKAGAAEEP